MPDCGQCGFDNSSTALYCQSCGISLQSRPPVGIAVLPVTQYGGFWKRVLAWLIDSIIVFAGTGILAATTFGAGVVAIIFGHWLYEAFMTSSPWQATLGKRALNMVVLDVDGRRISFARATGRYFSKWLSAMLLCFGFLMVAFTRRKQGLHDLVADTMVVVR